MLPKNPKPFWNNTFSKLSIKTLYLLILISLLTACGGRADLSSPDYFIPPTLVQVAIPIVYETPTLPPPSPTPTCTNDLAFLEDITVPDNTDFSPNSPVDKIWLVENNGSCNWDAGYVIRRIGGDALGAETQHALFPARSGSEVEIQVLFTAPEELGRYQSSWQAYDPQGQAFGDLFFIQIEVLPEPQPTTENN